MTATELVNWADVAGTEMLWYLQEYRKHGSAEAVLEIQHSLIELHAVVDELYTDLFARNMIG